VQYEGGRVGRDTNDQRHRTGHGEQQQGGIGRSIRPATAVQLTVLVADMYDGGCCGDPGEAL
jgi:hypothetical protein